MGSKSGSIVANILAGGGEINYDLLTTLVVITALATFALWRKANQPKSKQLSKKFRKALWESNPIEPKHKKPKFEPLRRSFAEWEAKFFYEFDDFADMMNWYLADDVINSRWRPKHLPAMLLSHFVGDAFSRQPHELGERGMRPA